MMTRDDETVKRDETPSEEAVRKIAESFGCDLEAAREIYDLADLVIDIR